MKFAKDWSGVKAGEIYPTDFKPGDECPEDLQESAAAMGALEEEKPSKNSKS